MGEVLERHLLALAAHRLHDQLINHEGLLGHHRLIARAQKGPHRQFDNLVGAVAKDQLLRRNSELFRQPIF